MAKHWAYDSVKREEVIQKLRRAKLGKPPWNKGISGEEYLFHFKEGRVWNKGLTKETDKRVKINVEGQAKTMRRRYKEGELRPWNKGLTKETDKRVLKNSISSKKNHPSKLYPDHNKKISESLIGKRVGFKHPNWRGGISYEPYGPEFDDELKAQILERDDHTCQCPNCEDCKDLCIHHIDYNKKNNEPKNLITLCRSCNAKANYNRNYWETILKEKIKCLIT